MPQNEENRITARAFAMGLLFSGLFAGITVYASDRLNMWPTATQIPVLPYVLLALTVLAINPLCGWLKRVRRFSPAEIMLVFAMGLVSSGVSTYGLTAQLVPVVGGFFNRSWNTEQSQWNRYVAPFVNEGYFLSASGIRTAAAEVALQVRRRDEAQARLNAAENAAQARRTLDGESGGGAIAPAEREWAGRALANWDAVRAAHPDLPAEAAAAMGVGRAALAEAEAVLEQAQAALHALESEAFDKVEAFRRGLPRSMRAYPGIVILPEDSMAGYLARLRRMTTGRRVAADLRAILKPIDAARSADAVHDPAALDPILERIAAHLETMTDADALTAQRDALAKEERNQADLIAESQEAIGVLHKQRREARRDALRRIDRDILGAQRDMRRLEIGRSRLAQQRENAQQQIETLSAGRRLIADAHSLREDMRAGLSPDDARRRLMELSWGLPMLDGTLRRFLVGDVPWRDWAGPLARWGLLIGLAYLVLMAFNVLIFRQWAHNEKLTYPLAELPMALAGVGDPAGAGSVPSLFRSGLFWTGAVVSGLTLGYNILAYTQCVPLVLPLELNNPWDAYITNTALDGLLGGNAARSHIFFTMIGLSFLVPKKVSFSLWFFTLLAMAQVLLLVAGGFGLNERSFPSDWWYTLNFRTAQGFGALIVFALVVLTKCRTYLLCVFNPGAVEGLPPDERAELRAASLVFLAGSAGVVALLWIGLGANPFYAVVSWFVILVMTIGLVRGVAEGGILGFQAWASPFHAVRTLFGMDRSWTAPSLFAPIMVFYSLMFLDIKTFIAPAMANSLKIRDTLRMHRGLFHAAILLSILVSAVVAVAVSVMMCYSQGADLMQHWFYTAFPRGLFDAMTAMSRTPPEAARAESLWLAFGAVAMALLLYFRQSAFWLPHPIGMIMLVNPIMGAYWFSIFLGWAFKALVTKYGNQTTYAKARTLFIGLIAGELLMVVIGMIVAGALDISVPVGLNRN